MPENARARIEAVAADMTTDFELEIQAHRLQAEVVYTLFHVVAKYTPEVINRVRVDEANRLKADKPARKMVKSVRRLLLRYRKSLKWGQALRLDELLAANQSLLPVYVLRDALKTYGDTGMR
jgi:transposase